MTQVLYMNYINRENFTYLVAQEKFVTNQLVFYFQRNHFLVDKMSDKIEAFREAGLINYLISKYVDNRFLKKKTKEKLLRPLTVANLSAVFRIWASVLFLSFLMFLVELLGKFKTFICSNKEF